MLIQNLSCHWYALCCWKFYTVESDLIWNCISILTDPTITWYSYYDSWVCLNTSWSWCPRQNHISVPLVKSSKVSYLEFNIRFIKLNQCYLISWKKGSKIFIMSPNHNFVLYIVILSCSSEKYLSWAVAKHQLINLRRSKCNFLQLTSRCSDRDMFAQIVSR